MKVPILSFLVACLCTPSAALSHFQEILPSEDVLVDGGPVTLDLVFTHPMDRGPVMDMAKPEKFGVKRGGTLTDLTDRLQENEVE
ncbi:MAG TPA: DUF4198 domain-containing protein, partial [Rhizobiaceae bacterium]